MAVRTSAGSQHIAAVQRAASAELLDDAIDLCGAEANPPDPLVEVMMTAIVPGMQPAAITEDGPIATASNATTAIGTPAGKAAGAVLGGSGFFACSKKILPPLDAGKLPSSRQINGPPASAGPRASVSFATADRQASTAAAEPVSAGPVSAIPTSAALDCAPPASGDRQASVVPDIGFSGDWRAQLTAAELRVRQLVELVSAHETELKCLWDTLPEEEQRERQRVSGQGRRRSCDGQRKQEAIGNSIPVSKQGCDDKAELFQQSQGDNRGEDQLMTQPSSQKPEAHRGSRLSHNSTVCQMPNVPTCCETEKAEAASAKSSDSSSDSDDAKSKRSHNSAFSGRAPLVRSGSKCPAQPPPLQRGRSVSMYGKRSTRMIAPKAYPCWIVNRVSMRSSTMAPIGRREACEFRVGGRLEGCAPRILLSPTAWKKVCWDLFSTLVISYDLLVLPLDAFSFDQLAFSQVGSLLTTLFWTSDLILSFFCGYHRDDGLIEMRMNKIARRYLRTWFPFDSMIVLVDWGLFFLGSVNEEAVSAMRMQKAARFIRAAKLFRLVRLVRVLKLATLYEEISEFILSSSLMAVVNIARMLTGLAIFVHYIACAWYAVGLNTYDDYDSWLTDWMGESTGYLYIISFHWTLAQFLPAPCREHPQNFYERLFTVFVLLTGFVLFSSALGSITAMITQSRQAAYKRLKETNLLRRFFEDNHVSPKLGNRITHFLNASLKRKARITVADVPILNSLPANLREDMLYQVRTQQLFKLPFFLLVDEVDQPALVHICVIAVQEAHAMKDEEVFGFGSKASCMRFVVSGKLVYQARAPLMSFDDENDSNTDLELKGGDYVSEPVLWSSWIHRGVMRSMEASRVVVVDADTFSTVAPKYPVAFAFCCEYACLYCSLMEEQVTQSLPLDDTYRAFSSKKDLLDQTSWLGNNDFAEWASVTS